MDVAIDKFRDVAVVVLQGETLNLHNARKFKRAIAPVLETNPKVVLDVSELQFVDSSGLGAILSCLRKLNRAGGEIRLCGTGKRLRSRLLRAERKSEIFNTKEEALRAFQQKPAPHLAYDVAGHLAGR
ncbi:MAG: STAS domain-containing protein [Nitrospinota bacterium]